MLSVGERAGYITESAAKLTGLTTSCAVTVNLSDAHAAVPAAKICTPGKMLMILGTSTCTMLLSDEIHDVPGICGIVKDGFIPGMYAYEAGQSCVECTVVVRSTLLLPPNNKKEAEEKRYVHTKAAREEDGGAVPRRKRTYRPRLVERRTAAFSSTRIYREFSSE